MVNGGGLAINPLFFSSPSEEGAHDKEIDQKRPISLRLKRNITQNQQPLLMRVVVILLRDSLKMTNWLGCILIRTDISLAGANGHIRFHNVVIFHL